MTELREEMFSNPYYCYLRSCFLSHFISLVIWGDLAGFSLVLNIGRIIMRGLQEFDDDQE